MLKFVTARNFLIAFVAAFLVIVTVESCYARTSSQSNDANPPQISESKGDSKKIKSRGTQTAQTNPDRFLDSFKAVLSPKDEKGEVDKWDVKPGETVTYSFVTAANATGYPEEPEKVSPVPNQTKTYVKEILEEIYASVIPINFKEITDTNDEQKAANIRVMIFQNDSGSYASAYYPKSFGDSRDGDVFLYTGGGDWTKGPGSAEYASLVHELGHAMGLKHPGRYTVSDEEPYLPLTKDNCIVTVMSYNVDTDLAEEPSSWNWSLMAYDIAALQSLYGANQNFQAGDTVYKFNSDGTTLYPFSGTDRQFKATQTIWDAGGTNTIDASQLQPEAEGYHFDLRPAGQLTAKNAFNTGSYLLHNAANQNPNGDANQQFPVSKFATVVGFGVKIHTLVGSSSNDEVIGNSEANLILGGPGNDRLDGGSGKDMLNGGPGDDVLIATQGADILAGGADNDTYLITSAGGGAQIQDTEGRNRIAFNDGNPSLQLAIGEMGMRRQNADLVIDLNRDGVVNIADDLRIVNVFSPEGTEAIETIGSWSGETIAAYFEGGEVPRIAVNPAT